MRHKHTPFSGAGTVTVTPDESECPPLRDPRTWRTWATLTQLPGNAVHVHCVPTEYPPAVGLPKFEVEDNAARDDE
eukprot:2702817-Rhodomonas_salina.1